MRRIWIFCLMTFLVIGVSLAQNTVLTHDVKGKVVDNYGQPVVGALVYVEGTELSTVTDVEGKFLLRGVPVSVEELTVEAIGLSKKQVKVDQPIQVGRRKRAKDVTSFVLSAGVGTNRFTAKGGSGLFAYELGMGVEFRMSRKWAFRPMLQFSHRGTEYRYNEKGYSYIETWKLNSIDVPLLYVNRHKVMRNGSIVLSFGPVLSFGIGGNVVAMENGSEVFNGDPYDSYEGGEYGEVDCLLNPFQFGAMYGIGFEYKKCMLNFYGKNMCLSYADVYNHTQFSFNSAEHGWLMGVEFSYRF